MTAPRAALVVAVPGRGCRRRWRERTSYAKPSNGVPAHVTVLYPFAPAAEVDDAFVTGLRELFAVSRPSASSSASAATSPRCCTWRPSHPSPSSR